MKLNSNETAVRTVDGSWAIYDREDQTEPVRVVELFAIDELLTRPPRRMDMAKMEFARWSRTMRGSRPVRVVKDGE